MQDNGKSKSRWIITIALAAIAIVPAFSSGYFIGYASVPEKPAVTLVDDYGRSIILNGFPEKIISVAPTPTEIIFAVGAGNLLVGVDTFSDYPSDAQNITKVGDFVVSYNIEKIVSLDPDIIISSDLVPQDALDTLLLEHGIPYMILAARTIDDIYKDIRLVGSITNHSLEANSLVDSMKSRVDAVTSLTLAENVSKPSVYIEYWPMWTFGMGSFGDDLIRLAGGENIAGNETKEYLAVTGEFVLTHDPEIIIYTVGATTTTTKDEISLRPGWDQIDAVMNDKIYAIDDNLISRYGPRLIDGLEELAELIHPELFD